jgi:DNA polymerase III subunit chi
MAMRIEFYAIEKPRFSGRPMELVCALAQKAFESQTPAMVLVDSMADAEALDELLWSYADDSFVPHQVAGDDDDDECPVLIVPPEVDAPARPLVVNLRQRPAPDGAERVIELIPDDEQARNAARSRWSAYKRRGHEPAKVVV